MRADQCQQDLEQDERPGHGPEPAGHIRFPLIDHRDFSREGLHRLDRGVKRQRRFQPPDFHSQRLIAAFAYFVQSVEALEGGRSCIDRPLLALLEFALEIQALFIEPGIKILLDRYRDVFHAGTQALRFTT